MMHNNTVQPDNSCCHGLGTRASRVFDLALIFFILLSGVLVMLDSIPGIHDHVEYGCLLAVESSLHY